MIGQTLNHYKIVSKLGRGGMGEVFVAEDTKLGRKVALKVLPPEMAGDAERRARFEREAKAVASLNHPNIVTVFSVEQAGETHFITMELVEGKTLSEILSGSIPSTSKLLDYAVELADAVTGAHRKGITHRDLKPDNVMLAEDGRIKVLDFGLAKVADGQVGASTQTLPTQTVTQEGKILGTVAYMSPEQAEGKTADARSDVFSLGVLLYEMTTGRRPFAGDTSISTITAILRDTPTSVTDLNQQLPRHLGRIVKRCMEKDPERRYQTAQDLRNDLHDLRDEMQSGDLSASEVAARAPAAPQKNWLAIGLGIVALAAIAVAAVQFTGGASEQAAAQAVASGAAMEITPLTVTGNSSEATISDDGRWVAYVLTDEADNRRSLWVTQVSTGSKVQITEPHDGALYDPAFSPDGELIYFVRSQQSGPTALFQVPALGGTPRKIVDDVQGRVSFAPDGERFVFYRAAAVKEMIVVAGIDGSNETAIATFESPDGCGDPSWSPNGKVIAAPIMEITDKGPDSGVITMAPDGSGQRRIASLGIFGVGEMSWLPDGSGLIVNREAMGTDELWEVAYPDGAARRVVTDLNSYHGAMLTADGTTLVTQQAQAVFNVWTLSAEAGAEPVQVTSLSRGVFSEVAWTPDGRISYTSNSGGAFGIWAMSPDGSDAARLVPDDWLSASVVWTSDGKYIVYLSNHAGTVNVWRADVDGGNPMQLTHGVLDVNAVITPNDERVVYQEITTLRLMQVPIDGGEATPFLSGRFSAGVDFSPDGTRVIATRLDEDEQKFQFEILRVDGGESLKVIEDDDANNFHWAPDGEALTFVRHEGNVGNLWRLPLSGGEPMQITDFKDESIDDYRWSKDGDLVVVRGSRTTDLVLLKNFR